MGNLKPAPFSLTPAVVEKIVGDRPAYGTGIARLPIASPPPKQHETMSGSASMADGAMILEVPEAVWTRLHGEATTRGMPVSTLLHLLLRRIADGALTGTVLEAAAAQRKAPVRTPVAEMEEVSAPAEAAALSVSSPSNEAAKVDCVPSAPAAPRVAKAALDKPEPAASKGKNAERDRAICARYRDGKSTIEVGQYFGVSNQTISNVLKKCGEPIRNARERQWKAAAKANATAIPASPSPEPDKGDAPCPVAKADLFELRRRNLDGAIAHLKRKGCLVQVVDRDAQIRQYRVSGRMGAMLAEHVIEHAVMHGFEVFDG